MESMKDEDKVIRHMAEKMMVKFDKYWEEYNVVLAFGAILDLRVKLENWDIVMNKLIPFVAKQS